MSATRLLEHLHGIAARLDGIEVASLSATSFSVDILVTEPSKVDAAAAIFGLGQDDGLPGLYRRSGALVSSAGPIGLYVFCRRRQEHADPAQDAAASGQDAA